MTLGSSKSPDLSKRHREGEMRSREGAFWERNRMEGVFTKIRERVKT